MIISIIKCGMILLILSQTSTVAVYAITDYYLYQDLTHWGRDHIYAVLKTVFLNAYSWMKLYEFILRFHWSLFLKVQLTYFKHWFRNSLGADQATSHYVNQWWLDYLFPDKIPFSAKSGRPFTFADYGCRDGGISVPLIKHLIGQVFWLDVSKIYSVCMLCILATNGYSEDNVFHCKYLIYGIDDLCID